MIFLLKMKILKAIGTCSNISATQSIFVPSLILKTIYWQKTQQTHLIFYCTLVLVWGTILCNGTPNFPLVLCSHHSRPQGNKGVYQTLRHAGISVEFLRAPPRWEESKKRMTHCLMCVIHVSSFSFLNAMSKMRTFDYFSALLSTYPVPSLNAIKKVHLFVKEEAELEDSCGRDSGVPLIWRIKQLSCKLVSLGCCVRSHTHIAPTASKYFTILLMISKL